MRTERDRAVETWATRTGVILAVAGSAVGLGNFLRFPGRAALYGGGTFMLPYFVSLLVVGIPIAWIEWTLGRQGGARGHHSAPGIFLSAWHHPASAAFGALAVFIPAAIYTYYVFIEAWCLGYAWLYAAGALRPAPGESDLPGHFARRFEEFVGGGADGALFEGWAPVLVFVGLCYAVNLFLVYRGVSRGIERFCRWAMPALLVAGLVLLVRVLTLGTPDPAFPDRSIWNGLGFMWNPRPVHAGEWTLLDPRVWLEAAGQIFFSLSVGFGVIVNYASYLRSDDDVTLSALSASAANETCEVCLGGLITIPAAFVFLGAAPLAAVAGSSIALGFHAVPVVFEHLPLGSLFGFIWFALLFLAAATSSISMLQPPLAFLEEGLGLRRGPAVAALGVVTALGTAMIAYFSADGAALEVVDFWVGSAALVVLALFEVLLYGWVIGAKRGLEETNRGSDVRVPALFAPIVRWVCPLFLVTILLSFAVSRFPEEVAALSTRPGRWVAALFLVVMLGLVAVLVARATSRGAFPRLHREVE